MSRRRATLSFHARFTHSALRRRVMELAWRRLRSSRGGGWAVVPVCGASEPAAAVARFARLSDRVGLSQAGACLNVTGELDLAAAAARQPLTPSRGIILPRFMTNQACNLNYLIKN